MKKAMDKVAKLGVELSIEERNLLSVAFKNVIGARRASWRIISSIEQKEENKDPDSSALKMTKEYRCKVSTYMLIQLVYFDFQEFWIIFVSLFYCNYYSGKNL